jgi:hypothetical protein
MVMYSVNFRTEWKSPRKHSLKLCFAPLLEHLQIPNCYKKLLYYEWVSFVPLIHNLLHLVCSKVVTLAKDIDLPLSSEVTVRIQCFMQKNWLHWTRITSASKKIATSYYYSITKMRLVKTVVIKEEDMFCRN